MYSASQTFRLIFGGKRGEKGGRKKEKVNFHGQDSVKREKGKRVDLAGHFVGGNGFDPVEMGRLLGGIPPIPPPWIHPGVGPSHEAEHHLFQGGRNSQKWGGNSKPSLCHFLP